MSNLYLYAVFHGNLNFSYIPKDFYPQILRSCYWPLLDIIEETQVPLGLEFSGHTLQTLDALDHSFVTRLRSLWQEGLCEVVGSGYVQLIMPLIPARVNRENLQRGNSIYQELLGKKPSVAYLNEQVYSAGIPRLYRDCGYQAIMANWESSLPSREDPELRYRPCAVSTGDGGQIPVIWHSTIAYRDFQRYVEREISLDTYLSRIFSHLPLTGERALPMYGSDWEVFDFKPWLAQPEGFRQPVLGEMRRIAELLARLKSSQDTHVITPSSVLSHFPELPLVNIESVDAPITYKKLDLHSVARWAVAGRDNVRLNTQCHQLYEKLLLVDWYLQRNTAREEIRTELETLWQELCFLWNSDFRTFTTEDKYLDFRNHMGAASYRADRLNEVILQSETSPDKLWLVNCSAVPAKQEPVSFSINTNGTTAGDHPTYVLNLEDQTIPCQVSQRSEVGRGANRLTVETLPGLEGGTARSASIQEIVPISLQESLDFHVDAQENLVETPSVRLKLLPQQGGAIESLAFPQLSAVPLICGAPSDAPRATWLMDHAFSGDLTLEDSLGRSITDHRATELQYPEPGEAQEIFVPIRCSVHTEMGTIWKTYRVYLHQPRVDLSFRFQWRDVVPKSFRLGRMILNSRAFDRNTLFYATTNGGEDIERFTLTGRELRQDEPMAAGGTARGCLGATEGWTALGDATKSVGFVTLPALLASVPMVHYEEVAERPDAFLLMLSHSLGEMDDTSHTLWRGHSSWSLSILGESGNSISKTRTSALLSNGGLVAWPAEIRE